MWAINPYFSSMFNYRAVIAKVQASAIMPGFQTVLVRGTCNKLNGLSTALSLCRLIHLAVFQINA